MSGTVSKAIVVDVEAVLLDETAGPGWVRLLLHPYVAGKLYGELHQFFEERSE